MTTIRSLVALVLAVGALASSTAASQPAPWPTHPIRLVVPFAPGGNTDTYARLIATELAKSLGQPVIVENRAGGSGNVGSDAVAKAAPDGYTLLVGGMNTHAINGWLYRDLPYDPVRDFAPIAPIAWSPSVLLVQASSGIAGLNELVALARAKPDTLSYGSAGVGVPGHLNVEWVKSITGARLDHVPYKGESEAVLALLRGDIVLASATVPTALPHVKAGRLRAIAIAADRRSPTLPDVATIAEVFPGVGSGSWIGLFGPAGLPTVIVQRINADVDRILRSPDMAARLAASDLAHVTMTPAAFGEYQKAEIAKWGTIIRSA
jgi:tripartite-type tricarboxylate transporter receptor subunit TctC